MRNRAADSTDTGTKGGTQQNRAADDGGDGSAADSADRAAGEGALLLVGHVIATGEGSKQQGRGGEAREG